MASSEAGRGDILSVYALIDRLYFVYLDFFQIIRGEEETRRKLAFGKFRFESGILTNSNLGLVMV